MSGTFSESWYRVAKVRAALRPSVTFRKARYQGEEWFILSDPYTGAYYRLTPAYYEFVSKLSFQETIEELWIKSLEEKPQDAPGQQDVITLLSELNSSNLIFFEEAGDSAKMFERQWKKDREKKRKQVLNFLFIRLPLGNPNRLLDQYGLLWKMIFNKVGLLIWLAVVLLGIKTAIDHAGMFAAQAANVLSPDNLILLYLSMAFIKAFHEWGHAAICKRFGGEVNSWGVMFVLFTPLPFVDATSAWILRDKWQRVLVGSGGMIVELFIGALACFVWASSPPGLVHAISYNMMLTASVSTLLFNANPLMRFDGYYIMSDLLEIPNLQAKSKEQVNRLGLKYLFGVRDVALVANSTKQAGWLGVYGILAAFYRLFLLVGIILFIADSYYILGLVLAGVMGTIWLGMPMVKYLKFLHSSPQLRLNRARALSLTYGLVVMLVGFLFLAPVNRSIEANGVVESRHKQELNAFSAGRLVEVVAPVNSPVKKDDTLIMLENPELDLELLKVQQELHQNAVMEQQVLSQFGLDRDPVRKNRESLLQLQDQLLNKKQKLVVVAPMDGLWVVSGLQEIEGQWISQGQSLGFVIDDKALRFSAVISQEDASDLFGISLNEGVIRFEGRAEESLQSVEIKLHPHAQEALPSAALGWRGGGAVATRQEDSKGLATTEPFYLVYAMFDGTHGLYAGQTGRIKIALPPLPLGPLAIRKVQQFLQKRYQL